MSPTLPTAVYVLCFLTSSACAWLLGRAYRRSQARLLLWSALCFALLGVNNLLVIFDLVILTDVRLGLARLVVMLAAVAVLLFGFVWDLEE